MAGKGIHGFSLPQRLRRWRRICLCVVFVVSSWCLPANAQWGGDSFKEDRILIKPKRGREAALQNFHGNMNARVLRRFDAFDNIEVLQLPRGAGVRQVIRRYQQSGLVEFAEPDFQISLASTPNDPRYLDGSLWHLHNTGQNGGLVDADIDGPEAWESLNSAADVIIAIIDTGVRYTHEDLAANMWVNPGEIPGNGIDDDGNGIIDDIHGINAANDSGNPIDLNGHGTQVAGIAGAAGNNGIGVAGIPWSVKIMACRFWGDDGSGFLSDVVQCVDYARAKGAKVINASFVTTSYSSSLYTAINNCRSAGIIFVAAAGNDTKDNDSTPYYPASFNLDNIVAVAATTRTDMLASYSNYGATSVDLGAPGSAMYTTGHSHNSAYVLNSGTSFAAPVVTGAFALMRARYGSETYKQLIDRVLAATDPLPGLSGKCVTGGRLNLANALGPSVLADFTATPTVAAVPATVNFTNTSLGNITNFSWNFGDGNASSLEHPTHTYASEGNFEVALTVTANGKTSTKTRTVSAVANYTISAAAYNWIDPTGMTSFSLANDGVTSAQPLPFSFLFYGQPYEELYIGANGLIGFSNQGLSTALNANMPAAAQPNNMICPFWDDLNPAQGGTIHMGTVGTAPNRKVVISWVGVRHAASPPATFTFQAVLEEGTHRILFQYQNVQPTSKNVGAAGKSATVGIEHSSGLVAAKHSFNGSTLLGNNQAILFTPTSGGGLSVTPALDLTSAGNLGGPFSPDSQLYTIENTGSSALNWAASKSQDWITLSETNGTLPAGQSAVITVSVNANAASLAAGSYLDTLSFQNLNNGIGNTTRSISLAVNGTTPILSVTPAQGFTASGIEGGPFVPGSQIYTLQNTGDASLAWSAVKSQEWLNLSEAGGILAAGDSTTVTVSINSDAHELLPGSYSDTVSFLNLASGEGDTQQPVTLTVNPVPAPQLAVAANPAELTLELIGEPLRSYIIEATADFSSWSSLATNITDAEGIFIFSEPVSGNDLRFYRGVVER